MPPRLSLAITVLTLALAIPRAEIVAQTSSPKAIQAAAREHRAQHDHEILRELAQLVAMPNLASDSANIRANARHLVAMLERRGVSARLLEAPGSPPAVYGELMTPGATRTIVFYAHYDGQPVDPAEWATPPFTPVLRDGALERGGREIPLPSSPGRVQGEWRLYGRSASDDKAPIVAMLAAIDALRSARIPLSVNLKFFLEGEEEAGSPHLRDMLTRHAELLRADLWLFGDGPVHQSRRPQVVFGVRGVMGAELTVYGATRPLHSGHYGNWAPNPLARLAELLAGMRDGEGRVMIDGFYHDVVPPTAAERDALDAMPAIDSSLRRELQLAGTEAEDALLAERLLLPALNIRGIRGGAVGSGAANVIVTEARASVDFRLVPEMRPERVRELVERHLRAHGWHVVAAEPTEAERLAHRRIVRVEWSTGYPATRTALDLPASHALLRVADEAAGAPVVRVPTLGGSLPMNVFREVLGVPLIVLPIVNHDNNQHAANENVRLQNLFDGMELYMAVLARLGPVWDDEEKAARR